MRIVEARVALGDAFYRAPCSWPMARALRAVDLNSPAAGPEAQVTYAVGMGTIDPEHHVRTILEGNGISVLAIRSREE